MCDIRRSFFYLTTVAVLCLFLTTNVFAFDSEAARKQYSQTTFKVADVSELSYENAPSIGVTFTVPLANGYELEKYLNVSQKNGPQVDGGWILSKSRTTAYFTNIEAVTKYTVTVYRGLQSVTHKRLPDAFQADIKTRRIIESVGFASSGKILPTNNSKGLPLYTTNVDAVDVDFHRVKSNKIGQFMSNWLNRQNQTHWNLRRYAPFIDLVHSGRFDLAPPKNKRHLVNLPVKDIPSLSLPGIYLAVMKKSGSYPNKYHATYFVVSDIGLHARFYTDRIDVHTNSLEKGTQLSGVTLTLLDRKNEIVAQTSTSPEGLGVFRNKDKRARILMAKKGNQIALLNIIGPALDISAFDLGDRPHRETEAFIYGPRDLYRPGETVIFNTLLRDGDARLVGNTPLKAIIRGADNREVQNTVLHGDQLAYYYHEFNLSPNAPTGKWKFQLYIGSTIVGEYSFKVEEFLPERMKLTIDDGVDKTRFINANGELTVPVKGAYLYGAPAAKNRLSSIVEVSQQRHPLKQYEKFYFGNVLDHAKSRRPKLADIKLDASGKGLLNVRNTWNSVKSPLDIHIVTSLYESGGRPVVRNIHYTTWPSEKIIGIRPLFEKNELDGNTTARFEVISSDKEGNLYSANNLEVKLIHERRNYFWVYNDSRGWHRESSDSHYMAFNGNFIIDDSKHATLEVPVGWGGYRLEVKDQDSGNITSIRFKAGWWYGRGKNNPGGSARPDRVELQLDKKRYKNGDLAKITVTAPYAGEGILLIESDKPLFWKRITVPADGATFEIPVDDEWLQHNIYISAVVFRPSKSLSEHMPNRAVGLLHLPLDREERKLSVTLSTPNKKVKPETTLPVTIKVDGIENVDEELKVTLAVVDVGVLNITDFETPDAHQWFFEPRRYSVDSRDLYGNIIDSIDGPMAVQRFGGDANLSRGGKKAQSDVQIVSLFSGVVTINDSGEAEINIELPDFNGRLRLMALVFGETTFGQTESEITVASPIIAEISMPRFLTDGDKSTIALDLHNLSGSSQSLIINTTASLPLVMDSEQQTLILADGEKRVLKYPIESLKHFGTAKINVDIINIADDEVIELNREWALKVRPSYPAVSQYIRRVLAKDESLSINDELSGLMPLTVEVELKIDSKPPIELNNHLKNLLRYPYGCLEQTTSSTYPWVFATKEMIGKLGLNEIKSGNVDLDKREEYLEKGLARLKNLQQNSGGFGLWSNNGGEQHWLTAYVSDFLTDLHSQGIAVDTTMFESAMRRLLLYVNSTNGLYGERWSENSKHYQFAYRAYAAYVLSKVNRAPLGTLRNMYDRQRSYAKSGLPLVHLGLALIKQGDRQRGLAAIEAALKLPVTTDRYRFYGDYGSPLRDYALMVYLLEENNVDNPGRSDLLFTLTDEIASRRYFSTQERLALFKAGVALSKQNSTAWAGELFIQKSARPIEGYGSYQLVFDNEMLSEDFSFTSKYNQRLFAEMIISGYPTTSPIPNNKDIDVVRNFYDLEGNKIASSANSSQASLPTLETGDLVLVHIGVKSKRRIPDALIVDLLPAGLELENQNLKHAVKLNGLTIHGKSVESFQRNSKPKHQEYRDDRYVAAIELNRWGTTHLFYLARAVTPGVYSIPPVYVEDMYRPFIQNISSEMSDLVVVNKGEK